MIVVPTIGVMFYVSNTDFLRERSRGSDIYMLDHRVCFTDT